MSVPMARCANKQRLCGPAAPVTQRQGARPLAGRQAKGVVPERCVLSGLPGLLRRADVALAVIRSEWVESPAGHVLVVKITPNTNIIPSEN